MKKLFVGNLSWKVTEETLRKFFEKIGEVLSAKVVVDQYTGKSKGFGFVEFANAEDALRAVEELDNKELDGRAIRVSEAQERTARPSGGEFRGGSRGGPSGGNGGGQRPFRPRSNERSHYEG